MVAVFGSGDMLPRAHLAAARQPRTIAANAIAMSSTGSRRRAARRGESYSDVILRRVAAERGQHG
jgi:hypothetical protein